MGFYELLGCKADAAIRTINRHSNDLAKTYHPDTGGSAAAFRYLRMAAEVLKKPNLRAEYVANGKQGSLDQNICRFGGGAPEGGGEEGSRGGS